ncbi:MAG: DUF4145 domain-containing protein [Patescibacteria group bacterium]
MSVDRKIFNIPFHKGKQPEWTCPSCNRGILKGKEGTFLRVETRASKAHRGHPDWEPEWISYRYSCQFVCTNPACEEMVFNVGTGSVKEEVDYNDEQGYSASYLDIFRPKFFSPHLNIFKISPNTPVDIRDSIEKSFQLFFINPSASANHMRIALEQLLDYLKVKKFETVKNKRFIISLHKRIESIPSKVSELKDLFFAVKWLGNDASHDGGVSMDNVMDVYDMFESILDEIFGKKTKEIKKIAKKINRRRR